MQYEYRPFGELLSCPSKNGLTRPKKVRGSGLPMVNMGELFANPRIFDIDMDLVPVSEKEKDFLLKSGDLLFARQSLVRDGAGQCSIFLGNKQPTVFESHLIRCRLNPDEAVPEFYFYYFRSPEGRVVMDAIVEQGAGAAGIRGSDLIRLSVPVPSLTHQREVAILLRLLDDRIDLLRQTNATLEAIAQALFKSWFIDFDPVRAKAEGRVPEGMDADTAALFPDSFEDSAVGEIPAGWTYCQAQELFNIGIGKTPPRKESQWFSVDSRDVRWLSIKDMGDEGIFASKTSEYLTADAISRFNVRVAPTHTVLMSFKLTVGRLTITDGSMATNEAIAHFTANESSPPFTFTYCYLKNFDYKSLGSTSSIAEATNSKVIKALPVLTPTATLVEVFHKRVAEMFERILENKRQAMALTELRDTLLPRLVTGKLRLPEAEAQMNEALA
ncbi:MULTISPECIES: restriction endonuclease subunit S [Burkholderia]|uniref:restriction endonuclease subunit S n=1 Tax=Burkholderia TaxID=32008 RepID=UPI000B7AC5DC|nr:MULTISPECIES: restriction endonuclease subunit S [Burkholderia]MCI3971746.1 restriction endonuclease subunit S [Burkholderia sp. HI4860]OXJ05941.1 restriction endonuclease [Burkholderia sp. AU33647]